MIKNMTTIVDEYDIDKYDGDDFLRTTKRFHLFLSPPPIQLGLPPRRPSGCATALRFALVMMTMVKMMRTMTMTMMMMMVSMVKTSVIKKMTIRFGVSVIENMYIGNCCRIAVSNEDGGILQMMKLSPGGRK